MWYRFGMTRQITVRLSDDIVEFMDLLVRKGKAGSRAMFVTQALEHERRRTIAARDAAILAGAGPDPDMDSLAAYAVRTPIDLD